MMKSSTELLPHQQDAVNKMRRSKVGALFMDMGTGKSRTVIELAVLRQHRIKNFVWFCPISLKETVRQEILKHTDSDKNDIYIFDHKTNDSTVPDCFWNIVGIESMSLSDRAILAANRIIGKKSFVIVDESSYIKGHNSKRTKWITQISEDCQYRMILTGTPISQGIVDLFSQMRFLSPKILGYRSFWSFSNNHLEYSEKFPGLIVASHNTDYLAAKIKPYVYQVTKDECISLPNKIYSTHYFSMSCDMRQQYEMVKDEILSKIIEDNYDSFIIFQLFTALQKTISAIPIYFYLENRRLKALGDVLDFCHAGKIIIWAKYRFDIDEIDRALKEKYGERSTALFYGDIKEKQRKEQVLHFRKDARFFISTPSCGGHGLTLNEADTVIFYNNGFKYSERIQAEDRCHRIGQSKKVHYIDLHCVDSIDDKISEALANKSYAVRNFRDEIEKVKDFNKIREVIKNL